VRKPRGGSGTDHLGLFEEAELLKLQKSGQFPDESVAYSLLIYESMKRKVLNPI
jgi:hypothetical protein